MIDVVNVPPGWTSNTCQNFSTIHPQEYAFTLDCVFSTGSSFSGKDASFYPYPDCQWGSTARSRVTVIDHDPLRSSKAAKERRMETRDKGGQASGQKLCVALLQSNVYDSLTVRGTWSAYDCYTWGFKERAASEVYLGCIFHNDYIVAAESGTKVKRIL